MRKKLCVIVLSLAVAVIFSIDVYAQTKTVLVSKNVKGANWEPNIAVDEKGNAVVVWVLTTENYTVDHIYAAYVKVKGSKLKVKNAIRISGDKHQNKYPSIRYQKLSGTFLVVWEALGMEGYSIQSRELDSSGQPVGAEKTVVTGNPDQFYRPILLTIDGARKLKKSYMLAWYQITGEATGMGVWTAILTSSGDLAKKPKYVFQTINTHIGGVQVYPTWLTSSPAGGYLLGVSRVESADNQDQRGHVIRLNKAGKKKKAVPLEAGDRVYSVVCEAAGDETILVSWYSFFDGTAFNRVFDSTLVPMNDAYKAYEGICNGSLFVRVGERMYQAFKVNSFGFYIAQYDESGVMAGPPTFVQAEKPLSGSATAVNVPGTKIILFATFKVITSGTDHAIYCISYTVPD